MKDVIPTVLGDIAVERTRATVILRVHTDAGRVALRFTPATAQLAGTELRLKAVTPVGERRDPAAPAVPGHSSEERRPVEKPGGGIL